MLKTRPCNGLLFLACALIAIPWIVPGVAHAQVYTQLQVLLPGETPAPGTVTGKLGTPATQTVGVPFDVRVRACDDSWNTVTTVSSLVSFSSSDGSASLPAPATLVNGEKTVSVTLNAAGSFSISAQDESDITVPEAFSASVTALALAGFEFNRINQKNQYAGIPMPLTVTAVDASGAVVSGFNGTVLLREETSFGPGRTSPDAVTLTNGTWSGDITMYRADETSIARGNVNVYAYLEADPTKSGTSDPFTVHPGTFARVQIIVPGQSPAPGSVAGFTGSPASQGAGQNFTVDVYGTDDYWNVLPTVDVVRVSSSDPLASTPATAALSNGHVALDLSLATVGTQTLSVTDQTSGSIQGMTSQGIPVTPSAPDHFVIESFPTPITAGDTATVTIRATDVGGNTIPDYSGNAILTANTGPASISPEAIVFAGGTWTGPVVFRGAGGAVALTCADYASPPHTGTSASFQVLAGPFAKLQVLLPGQTPLGGTAAGYSGTPNDQNAGSGFSARVRAVDRFWNRVNGVTDTVTMSSSDPFADLPATVVLDNGEVMVPVTLFKAGNVTVTAAPLEGSAIEPCTSDAVSILSGPYAKLLLLAPGESPAPGTENGRTGTATDQSINFAFHVEVYATDNWWNPVNGVSDVVHLSCSDALAELPADTTLVDGHVSLRMRLSTGGYQLITASNVSQPSIPSSSTQVLAISSGFHLEAEVSPLEVQAGEPFTLTVRVTNDAGSVIEEINSTVDVEVQNAATREPGRGALSTTRFQLYSGQRTLSETYTAAETIILIIRDDAGNDPAVTEAIKIDPGFPSAIVMSVDPPWVRANKQATVTARVVDAYDNGVPDVPVSFELTEGGGSITAVDSLSGGNGGADALFLGPRVAGMSRVQASAAGIGSSIQIETALVDPDKPGGTVTNYPNPFHPGETPTTIAYKLDADATVTLTIYTLSGNLVLRQEFPSGASGGRVGLNEFLWDGRNGKGTTVSSGGYIVHIRAEGAGETLHDMRRAIAVVR